MDPVTVKLLACIALFAALIIVMCPWDSTASPFYEEDKDLIGDPVYEENPYEESFTFFYTDRTCVVITFPLHDRSVAPRKEEFMWAYCKGKPVLWSTFNR